jgi:hypothetical protein
VFSLIARVFLVLISPVAAAIGLYVGTDVGKILALLVSAGVLAIGTGFVEWLNVVRPARKINAVRGFIITQNAAGIMEPLTKKGIAVRMNLMIPFRPMRFGFRRYFRIVWGDGMSSFPDADIWIPVRCGVVGKAYATGYATAADAATLKSNALRFPRRLRAKVEHLTCVVSHPVYAPDHEPGRPRGTRIGYAVHRLDNHGRVRSPES